MNYVRFSMAGVIAAAGCASTHVNFYTLSPTPPSAAQVHHDALAVQLPPARVPAQVNRREIVVRESSNRLALLENEHWASSPGDEISSAALVKFSAQLGRSEPSIRRHVTALALSIDVHQIDAFMNHYDILSATWSAEIHQGAAVVKLTCSFSASRPIASGVGAVVVGYQQEVAELGDAMALGVLNSLSQHSAICPTTHGAKD